MNRLREALADYLAVRRALGYKLERAGKLLRQFLTYLEEIGAFLDHLESERGNSVRTRNARLAAIHSLFRFAVLRHPEHAAAIERVLVMPPKQFERALLTYLTEEESEVLLAAPTEPPGPADVTTPSWCWPSKPA